MFGTTVDSTTSMDNGEDTSEDDHDDPMSIGSNIIFEWKCKKFKLDHDYDITRWALSVMTEVWANIEERLT